MDWISVKDRLPKDDNSVLVCGDKYNVKDSGKWHCVLCYNYVLDAWTENGDSWYGHPVTHWTPLTEPYKS